jgi:hypothetical protein
MPTGNQASPSNAPAQWGVTRTGGGPDEKNYYLGGRQDYAGDYAAAGNAEYGRRAGVADQAAATAAGRATPQTNFAGAQGALEDARGGENNQQGVYSGLMNFANGPQGPSGAQAMLTQGANQSMRGNLALARSGAGFGESAGGLASAQRANVDATANAANQAAMLRAQEDANFRGQQLQAFGAAGNVAGQQSQSALGRAGQQAGQAQFMTDAELRAQQERDQAQLAFQGQGLDAFGRGRAEELQAQGMNQQGTMGLESTRAEVYGMDQAAHDRARELNQKRSNDWVNGVTGALTGLAGVAKLSDRRSKKNIRKIDLAARYAALT